MVVAGVIRAPETARCAPAVPGSSLGGRYARRRVSDVREVSDELLVVGIGRWGEEALAEVYRRHGGPVFGLARRVLGDATLAEEVTQEVFLLLWREPGRFDPDRGSLRSYL